MTKLDKRFNEDGSINIEELNKAYTRHYSKYDERNEMRKLLDAVVEKEIRK
ncbi:hypothetical protein HY025_00015 [Candidatus Daviesbacteria bacterium]|nr:hypothetical protein [Candidatus Daviesbacteria bacterium]